MESKKQNSILNVAVVIFAGLSAYTTAIGIMLIWSPVNAFERYAFSWLFAIATSLIMIYLIMQLPNFVLQGKGWFVFVSYLIIASISIFFNFNAFYNFLGGTSDLADTTRTFRDRTNQLAILTIDEIENYYNLPLLQYSVDSLKAAAKSEEFHNVRPGAGPLHQSIKERLNVQEEFLKSARLKTTRVINLVDSLVQNVNAVSDEALINKQTRGSFQSALEQITMNHGLIKSILVSHSKSRTFADSLRLPALYSERAGSPEQSLQAIINLFLNFSLLKSWEKYSVVLSTGLAIALDLPIFLALFILHMGGRTRQEGKAEKVAEASSSDQGQPGDGKFQSQTKTQPPKFDPFIRF